MIPSGDPFEGAPLPQTPPDSPSGDPDRVDSHSETRVDPGAPGTPAGGVAITGYAIAGKIHQGGQGVVFRALQLSTKREVAIKVLREGPYATAIARKRFQREVEIVARLEHPNIVSIFDSGETVEGYPFYVMEYVRGHQLDEHVAGARPGLRQLLALLLPVFDAVGYAHNRGIVHRDLKPPNVLVDGDGRIKVLDFGLARAEVEPMESVLSVTGQFLGTVAYMSPEQVGGDPDDVGPLTDVYALGVMTYRLIAGCFPYGVQGQLVDVLRNIGEAEPLPLAKAWNPETGVPRESQGDRQAARSPVDGDLETIVHKAMAKEPQRRYPSMEAFAEDVRRYLDGRPILAKRDSALYVLRKRIRRNRSRVAVAVFTTVLLGVTIGVLSMQGPSRPPLAPELLQRFDAAEIEYVEVRGELLDVIEKREAGGDSLMTPGTLESLRILQDATGELRRAIERDPQSPELRELLMATFAKELGLLRRICSISG